MTHLPDAAAATHRWEPTDVPQERIGVLDVARGIAILGTLATNIWIFTDPGGIVGYLQRPLPSLTGGLEQTVQTIARQLANGKFLGCSRSCSGLAWSCSAGRHDVAAGRGPAAIPGGRVCCSWTDCCTTCWWWSSTS